MPGKPSEELYGGIYPFYILSIGDNNLDARVLKHAYLLLGLRHGAHDKHLRLQVDDLFYVGLRTGRDCRNIKNLLRIITVSSASYDQIARAYGIQYLTV